MRQRLQQARLVMMRWLTIAVRSAVVLAVIAVVLWFFVRVLFPAAREFGEFREWKYRQTLRLKRVVVEPNDTLWGIAVRHMDPTKDPRDNVNRLMEANGLDNVIIQPGQQLLVPVPKQVSN